MRRYHLMGTCHVDLTWHGDENQYADYMEQFTVILVDMLEQKLEEIPVENGVIALDFQPWQIRTVYVEKE